MDPTGTVSNIESNRLTTGYVRSTLYTTRGLYELSTPTDVHKGFGIVSFHRRTALGLSILVVSTLQSSGVVVGVPPKSRHLTSGYWRLLRDQTQFTTEGLVRNLPRIEAHSGVDPERPGVEGVNVYYSTCRKLFILDSPTRTSIELLTENL